VFSSASFGNVQSPPSATVATVAALVAMNRPDQLRFHLGFAVQTGVKKEELIEVITHLAFYSGWPKAMSAIMVAKEVLSKD
jgi:4-carboxymuconolactone decarboxylase